MYAGRVVETAAASELIAGAAHPYSRALIDCIPRPPASGGLAGGKAAGCIGRAPLPVISGSPPKLYDLPEGCSFAPRCARADGACRIMPESEDLGGGRRVSCHHPLA
jgi:oligopeptide/dipeptide ABC transporter ATP-binding protein